MISIVDVSHDHIEQATQIAARNYAAERKLVPSLPPVDVLPDLTYPFRNGYGSVAFENGEMVGFLCFYPPFDNAFGTTNVRGAFSPIHAHGAVEENRGRIYSYLYQATADMLVRNGVLSHAVALYAHDAEAMNSFFHNGFGLRCIDAVRPLVPLPSVNAPACAFSEVPKDGKGVLTELQNIMRTHLGSSPCFMPFPLLSEAEFTAEKDSEDVRYFAAQRDGKIVAYIKIRDAGENFVGNDRRMVNICGACCLPAYRGTGLFHNLLAFLIDRVSGDGYTGLGVDFETFNPAARGFWLKHFTAYTGSVVRRIDDAVLKGR